MRAAYRGTAKANMAPVWKHSTCGARPVRYLGLCIQARVLLPRVRANSGRGRRRSRSGLSERARGHCECTNRYGDNYEAHGMYTNFKC